MDDFGGLGLRMGFPPGFLGGPQGGQFSFFRDSG